MLGVSYREHKTNEYVWQQVIIHTGRQELLLSSVASYHGSAVSLMMVRCQRSYYEEQWMVGVAEEDLAIMEGQHQGMDRPVDVVIAAHSG